MSARTFLEHLGIDGALVDVEHLTDASVGQLLACALRQCDDDPVRTGIHAVIDEIEILYDLEEHGGGMQNHGNAISQIQSRLRVLAELHRRAIGQAGKELAAALAAAPKKKGGAK